MKVLHVAAEVYPLLKTGGLADVTAALPLAQATAGDDVRLLLPGFASVLDALHGAQAVCDLWLPWASDAPTGPGAAAGARVLRGALPALGGLGAYVVDAPTLFCRPGGPYTDTLGRPWPDNHRRFAPLGWAAAQLALGADAGWRPEVVHAHDWHTGLVPACMAQAGRPAATVFTIHNLAYQGLFPAQAFLELGLQGSAWSVEGLEFYGQVSFLKAGLRYADRVSTVSPTYAREVCTLEQGCGLDGVLRALPAGVTGILNGVDEAVWNPAIDPLLPQRYRAGDVTGKAACKAALQAAHGLTVDPKALLFGVVSRFTEQKGLHLVLQALPELLAGGGQLLALGTGEPALEAAFAEAAAAHPGRVAVCGAHDEALAHRVFAGSDVILVPSRFEPCGLTQLYAMAYGALPLVHAVGGLADTVTDVALENLDDGTATGFTFRRHEAESLRRALRRAFALARRPGMWAAVQGSAMRQRFPWSAAAERYAVLYQEARAAAAGSAIAADV